MPRSGPLPAALSLLLATAALLPGPAAAQNGEGGGGGGGGALLRGRLVAMGGGRVGQLRRGMRVKRRGLRGRPLSPVRRFCGGGTRPPCVFGSLRERGEGSRAAPRRFLCPPLLLRRLVLPVKWNISSRLLNLHLP